MKHKFENIIVNSMIGFLMLSLLLVGVRLLAKEILVDRLGMENRLLQVIADYTWGDVMEKRPSEIEGEPSEELVFLHGIYEKTQALAQEEKTAQENEDAGSDTKLERLENKVLAAENKVEIYCTQKYAGYYAFKGINSLFDGLMCWEPVYARENGTEFFLKSGVAYTATEKCDMSEKAETIMAMAESASENGAGFLFVQPPYRTSGNSGIIPWGASTCENENADELLETLSSHGIRCLDLRSAMQDSGWSVDGGFFLHDGHWTIPSALMAANEITKELNQSMDCSYDSNLFEPQQFAVEQYSTNNIEAQEDVTMLLPSQATDLLFVDGYRNVQYRGTYEEACLDMDMLEEERSSALTIYSANRIRNSYLCAIYNQNTVNNPKRILILSNSFSWYIASFLALDTSEVVYSYYYDNVEAAETLIQELQPDTVLVLY